MSEQNPVHSPTIRLHKREVIWQIILPFVLVSLALLAAAVWLVLGDTARDRAWADVSMLWLLAPLLLLSLAALALLAAMIVGMAKLLQVMPRFTTRAQQVAGQIVGGTRKGADGAVQPFIWVEQAGAVLKSIFKHKR